MKNFRSVLALLLVTLLTSSVAFSAQITQWETLKNKVFGTSGGESSILGAGDLNGIIKALSAVVTFDLEGEAVASTIWDKNTNHTNNNISYSGGNVGIGTTVPSAKLEVSGAVKIGDNNDACTVNMAGAIRYRNNALEFCNSTEWRTLVAGSSCSLGGTVIGHGSNITAYQSSSTPYGSTCTSQIRTCNNGALSGSYEYANCNVRAPANCSFNNGNITVNHGSTYTETCGDSRQNRRIRCPSGPHSRSYYTATLSTVSCNNGVLNVNSTSSSQCISCSGWPPLIFER